MDRDSSGNFIIGGSSSSSDLISATSVPNPYVIYFSSSGIIDWTKQFSTTYNSVEIVKFDASNSANILVALNRAIG